MADFMKFYIVFILVNLLLSSCNEDPYKKYYGDFIIYKELPIHFFDTRTYDSDGVNISDKDGLDSYYIEAEYNVLSPLYCRFYKSGFNTLRGEAKLSFNFNSKSNYKILSTDELIFTVTHSYVVMDTLWLKLNDEIDAFVSQDTKNLQHFFFGISTEYYTAISEGKYASNPSFIMEKDGFFVFKSDVSELEISKYYHAQLCGMKSALTTYLEIHKTIPKEEILEKIQILDNSVYLLESYIDSQNYNRVY